MPHRLESDPEKSAPASGALLHAVVLAVPDRIQSWRGRIQVRALSRFARVAARQSARRAGGLLRHLEKNSNGAPRPSNGWHWSVAHKPKYVAGIAGPGPLGIDIEPLRRRSPGMLAKIADPAEWRLGSEDEWQLFYRYWTAKEAVLKAVGLGLQGLSDCRIVRVETACRLTLVFRGRRWSVRQSFRYGYWAAVAAEEYALHWHWPEGPG